MTLNCLIAGLALAGAAPAAAPPEVEVSTLDAQTVRGVFEGLGAGRLALQDASTGSNSLPLEQVLRIDFLGRGIRPANAEGPAVRVVTVDGAEIGCKNLVTDGRVATLMLTDGQRVDVPLRHVAGALLMRVQEAEAASWRADAQQKRSTDRLIIERDGKRHQIEGIVGAIGPDSLTFVLDEDTLTVQRDRVYGVMYAHRGVPPEAQAAVRDDAGNVWVVDRIEWDAGGMRMVTTWGYERTVPVQRLVSIDFSRGRIAYLSDLNPTLMQHTPYFDVSWDYRRNVNFSGGPLTVAGVEFARGLAVHSKTLLEYELGGLYRRFDAFIGIDDAAGTLGDAIVRIRADGELLLERRVEAGHTAQAVLVSVEGADKLTLEVDYGNRLDLGDHVVFGNARLSK